MLAKNLPNSRKFRDGKDNIITGLLFVIILLVVGYIAILVLGNAIDQNIDNQNTMLCKTALETRNEKYLNYCEGYYQHGDIRYMRGIY